MEMTRTVSLAVIAAMTLFWTLGLVVVLLLVRRLATRTQEFMRMVEFEIRPVMQDVRDMVRTASKLTTEVAHESLRLRGVMTSVEEAGENLRMTTNTIRAVFGSRLIPIAGMLAGMRGGVKYLWKQYSHRR